MPWDPDCYEAFRTERYLPFWDTLALIQVQPGLRVIDLGCGTGELTVKLAEHLPDSQVTGLDSSSSMLAQAYPRKTPRIQFQLGDLANLTGQWEVIFSHAALQWVENHAALIPQLFEHLKPGGQLVVQMPSNHHHLSHQLIQQLAAQEPFMSALGGWQRQSPVLPPGRYAELLYACGGIDLVVFEKVYPHVLANAQAIVDWVKGTALVPYLEKLPPELQVLFLEQLHSQLQKHFPQSPVFYGFQRILFRATKPLSASA